MTALTRSVCRETGIKTVGLCHEVGNFCMDLAIALGRPLRGRVGLGDRHQPLPGADLARGRRRRRLRPCCASWSTRSAASPRCAPYPGRPEAETFSKLDFAQRHLFKLTLLDRWGTFPAAGDRHIAEFVSFALTPESEWGAAYNIALSPISRREQHQAEYVADVDAWLAGTKDLQTWQSGELPSPMIQAMLTGEPFEAPVNIPNAGQAVGLPADAVLESICVIDGDGIRGRDRSVLPPPYDEIVRRHVATQELTVEAALRGDRTLAGEAFALDPLAGPGRPAHHGGHGRRAARRHGGVAAPVRLAPTGPREGTRMRIGFIGLGAMGLPMAGPSRRGGPRRDRRLAGPGAHRRRRGPGGDRRGLAAGCGRGIGGRHPLRPQFARGGRGGRRHAARSSAPGKTVVDCSTIDPEVERAQHARVGETGAHYLDAPLSGGTAGARQGHAHAHGRRRRRRAGRHRAGARALRRRSSCTSGGPGMGQVVKLCNQVIYAAQMTATAEATAMAVKSGVDMDKLLRGAHPRHGRLRGGADPPAGARRRPREPGVERLAARLHDRPHGQGPRPGHGLRGARAACRCPRRRRRASCSRRPARPATGGRTSPPWPRWSWRWPAPHDEPRPAAHAGPHPRGGPPRPRRAHHRELGRVLRRRWRRRCPSATASWPRPSRSSGLAAGGPPHRAAPHLPLHQPDRPGRLGLRARRPPGGQRAAGGGPTVGRGSST